MFINPPTLIRGNREPSQHALEERQRDSLYIVQCVIDTVSIYSGCPYGLEGLFAVDIPHVQCYEWQLDMPKCDNLNLI